MGLSIPYLLAAAGQLKGRQSKAGNSIGASQKYQISSPVRGSTGATFLAGLSAHKILKFLKFFRIQTGVPFWPQRLQAAVDRLVREPRQCGLELQCRSVGVAQHLLTLEQPSEMLSPASVGPALQDLSRN